ncbi:MAG: SpoIVB peptidase S55 domain-containing protein [Candidatus Latescibacterota bacterium]|nr:SpoIVB peptidase S55 domain-containing protein [Candidatus Latescibacterota bacterium]
MHIPMPYLVYRLCVGLLLCALCTTSTARAVEEAFMSTDQIERGMRGYGLSVFQGVEIDTFGVEILGVMRDAIGPGHDLILARMSGADLEHTGIIRGMSGSPVYLEDRLIGAVAYGWSHSKDPIGGIMPIAPMIDVAQRKRAAESTEAARQSVDFSPADWSGDVRLPQQATLERLSTPVALTGFSGSASSVLEQALAPFGMDAVAGMGGRAADEMDVPLSAGAGLGVQLISGDRSATAVGTLTWTDGEHFVGFGHPLMHIGATEMPATSVYVHQIIPSQINSFKLGSAVRPVGTVYQDRQAGIGGHIGPVPAMLPVTVDIASESTADRTEFSVMRHRDLTPVLVRSVLVSAVESAEKLSGDAALNLRASIALRDGRRVEYEQFYSGPSAALIASVEAVQPMVAIAQSPFTGIGVDSVHFAADVRETLTLARITGLRLTNAELRAGQRCELSVTMQPYRAPAFEQRIELAIPPGTQPGPLSIVASSGEIARQLDRARRPDASVPRSADELLKLIQEPGRADELVIEVVQPQSGLTVHGREFPSLPPSARSVLGNESSAGHLGPVSERVLVRVRQPMGHALTGQHVIQATITSH